VNLGAEVSAVPVEQKELRLKMLASETQLSQIFWSCHFLPKVLDLVWYHFAHFASPTNTAFWENLYGRKSMSVHQGWLAPVT
jgi:hypothetical protein